MVVGTSGRTATRRGKAGTKKPAAQKKNANPVARGGTSATSSPSAPYALPAAMDTPIDVEVAARFAQALESYNEFRELGHLDPGSCDMVQGLCDRFPKNRRTLNHLRDGRPVEDDVEMRFLIDLERSLTCCEILARTLDQLSKAQGGKASRRNAVAINSTIERAERLAALVSRCRPVVQNALRPLLERVAEHAGGVPGMAVHTVTGLAKRAAEFGSGVGTQAAELAQRAREAAAPIVACSRSFVEQQLERLGNLSFVEELFGKDDDDSDVRPSK